MGRIPGVDVDRLAKLIGDYGSGLDRRTRPRTVSIVPDFAGYFKVVDADTGDALMCAFDTVECGFFWSILHGHMPVRSDADTIKFLKMMEVSER